MTSVQTKPQLTYTVHCPKTKETEVCYSQDQAVDVAFAMHSECDSYVWVEDYLGHTVIEYGDIIDGIAELVFAWLTVTQGVVITPNPAHTTFVHTNNAKHA